MRALFLAAVLIATPALATAEPVDGGKQTEVYTTIDTKPARKSYFVPLAESVLLAVGLNASAQLIGYEWAHISRTTISDNLQSGWVFDEDPFTINGLAHPYGGAWPFAAARSTGHGFWVSTLYTAGTSALWEIAMENEPPSLNDQITTTVAGALVGEALHRMGRALRYGNPGIVREIAAAVLDPMGTFNGQVWGKAWRDKLPASYYAHIGVGFEQLDYAGRHGPGDQNAVHVELVLQHGLPGDRDLALRRPLDHFDVRAAADIADKSFVGTVDIRGLVLGKKFSHGFYGLYGTYDFMNPDRVRVHAIGVGPGIATEGRIGKKGYVRATGVATFVPWGSAGGESESEDAAQRDYQHGPGLGQIVELELGRHDTGGLRLTSRAWEIDGKYTGDGRELIMNHTLAGHISVAKNHAIGIEGAYSLRSPTFQPVNMDVTDRAVEIRVFYALTSGGY